MAVLKKRHRMILLALKDLGGVATTRQIAEKANLNTNGVSQSLGSALWQYVWCLGGRGGETKWKLKFLRAMEVLSNKKGG